MHGKGFAVKRTWAVTNEAKRATRTMAFVTGRGAQVTGKIARFPSDQRRIQVSS
jgi:hypothetical protein